MKPFRNRRRTLCERYLSVSGDEFQTEVERTKDAYLALMGSGLKEQPLNEEEQGFLNDVLEQDFASPDGLQSFFVMMLYCSPHQLPQKWRSRLSVPTWAAVYLHRWFNRGIPPVTAFDEARLVNQLYEYARSYPDSKGSVQKIRTAFSRLNGVQACDPDRDPGKQWFIPLFKARIFYTPVPKCACTSVKTFIFECERGRPYSPETTVNAKDIHTFYNTWKNIIGTYVFSDAWLKVLIVRDPAQRCLSCYKDKVLSRKILLKSQNKLAEAGLPVMPDFDLFVDNLERYRSLNGQIKHHTDPIVLFAESPDVYDVILNTTELDRLPAIVADRSDCLLQNMPHEHKTGNALRIEDLSQQTV